MKAVEEHIIAGKAFTEKLLEGWPGLVKAVWMVPEEDILTFIVLVDDSSPMESLTVERLKLDARVAVGKIKKTKGTEMRVLFYMLTDYWELIRHGSPVTFAEIREGLPVYDPSGWFVPLKKLLAAGRIPGTKEAMKSLLEEAPMRLLRIEKVHMARVVSDLAEAVVDAGQAPLLAIGVAPPTPRELAGKLKIHFIDKGLLEPEYADHCREIVEFSKSIEHCEVEHIGGEQLDMLLEKATRFVERMERLMKETSKGK